MESSDKTFIITFCTVIVCVTLVILAAIYDHYESTKQLIKEGHQECFIQGYGKMWQKECK